MFKKIHTKEIEKTTNIRWGEKFQILQRRSIEEIKLKKALEDDEKEEKILKRKTVMMESKIYVELISANKN